MKFSRSTSIAALCGMVASILNADGPRFGGAMPQQLIGAWTHTEWQAGFGHYDPDRVDQFDYHNQDPVGWTDAYRFFPDGSYQHAHFASLDIPGCDAKTLRQEIGWAHVSSQAVTFENRTAKLSAQDRCHRQNNFQGRPDKLAGPRTFEWRMARNRNGQAVLVLRNGEGREIDYHLDPSGHI